MTDGLIVIAVRQAARGARYLAVSALDATRVRRDPTCLDSINTEACLDVDEKGNATWERPFRCLDSAAGRAAIRAHTTQR